MSQYFNSDYWNQRWQTGQTGWDIGYASPAILDYFKKIDQKNIKILIPGCGNAYEAEALEQQGFRDIHLVDISQTACENLYKRYGQSPNIHIHCGDFFDHTGSYDCIIEQTFFCSLAPTSRGAYVLKSHELLKPAGILVGLLFASEFAQAGPPFGGNKSEYKAIFENYFHIKCMEICEKSIKPRRGNELFIELIKK